MEIKEIYLLIKAVYFASAQAYIESSPVEKIFYLFLIFLFFKWIYLRYRGGLFLKFTLHGRRAIKIGKLLASKYSLELSGSIYNLIDENSIFRFFLEGSIHDQKVTISVHISNGLENYMDIFKKPFKLFYDELYVSVIIEGKIVKKFLVKKTDLSEIYSYFS